MYILKNDHKTIKYFINYHISSIKLAGKIEILTLLLLLTGFLGFSQDTYVPDDNFEQALIDLGFDDVLDDNVLTANISGVSYLNVANKGISDLTGIEDFLGLEILDCQNNALSSLDMSPNPDLFILRCYNNQLTSLDVTQNSELERLLCTTNMLTSLDVSQNSLLWLLECAFNQLTSLDITQNTALQSVTCSYNQLSSLDVTHNINLIQLSCNDNQLTGTIDVSQNTALDALNVFDNQLTSLDVTQNVLLTDLDCSFNNISSLDITQNPALELFSCRVNQISNLDLSQNVAISDLSVHNNQLNSLDVSQCQDLIYLGCYNNQLTSLNVKNGNNSNMLWFRADNNPNLLCVDVDDITYANTNWTDIDTQTNFSEDCSVLSVIDTKLNESIKVYPNPASSVIHISGLQQIQNVEVYNLLGKKVKQVTNNKRIIDISQLYSGVYLVKIVTEKGQVTKRVVVE